MTRTTQKLFGLYSSALLLIILPSANAAPFELTCPAKYPDPVELQSMQTNGWRVPFPGGLHARLTRASVSLGPPEENGELRGTPLRSGVGERFHLQGFDEDLEKWAFCGYEVSSGDARLMQRIPANTKVCETHVKQVRGRLVAAGIRCK